MGVHGWNRFMAEKGWLPDLCSGDTACCSTRLFSNRDLFGFQCGVIPDSSELHMDGYHLCFYVHKIAYARHMAAVLGTNNELSPCKAIKKPSQLSPDQVRQLLPTFLPLQVVHQVTKEIMDALVKSHRMKVTVYWDGKKRYIFKESTDQKRQNERLDEWSDYQMYCETGRLPSTTNICELEKMFPTHRLLFTQVRHTLKALNVPFVHCDAEADPDLARAARHKPNAFVVGYDSDFCFFPDIQYLPMTTIDVKSVVTASVLRRSDIVESLELPDEDALVELAILMGNDFVDPGTAGFLGTPNSKVVSVMVKFLRKQGPGYRVSSALPETSRALRFLRMLYSSEQLSEFEFGTVATDVDAEPSSSSTTRPSLPRGLEEIAYTLDPKRDSSVKDAVLRYLRHMFERSESEDRDPCCNQRHLDAFEKMALPVAQHRNAKKKDESGREWRPNWEDVTAVYAIEKTIQRVIEDNFSNPTVRLNPPFSLFDEYTFYSSLYRSIEKKQDAAQAPKRAAAKEEPKVVERPVLPVDEFEETILRSVRMNRVTIIQGETGCGKSSRIPVMLLKAPPTNPLASETKLFISQPRRIAAKALVERLRDVEPDLRDEIALRMGHGFKGKYALEYVSIAFLKNLAEYENNSTRAWFVTTGYLVRLLANNPERFKFVSYIVVDEVHERSVDTDILCLLCRRLLISNPHIRLVLMSATLAAALYQDYFDTPEPPIKVGARRFPVEEIYLDDIPTALRLPAKQKAAVAFLLKEATAMKCLRTPSMNYMERLYATVGFLATVVSEPGSSVLVFVPGMNDIIAISDIIDQMFVPGVSFTCFPVHSEIPFEDQMKVFCAPKSDEIKVIIATNAAESSVTLPDVDNVICLGLCKQIVYNEASHRQMLLPTWISKASGIQRAGRVGRVRPGRVFRMYPRETFELHMEDFEPGEMLRIPLDSVILMLKEMLPQEDSVTDILLNCIEPPNTRTIDKSLNSLFRSQFTTCPDDNCGVTRLGSFVCALGIDLSLGSLIGLGIQFGVGAAAIQLAAVLSFPKSPWIMSNPLIHSPRSYNGTVSKSFVSKCYFDAHLFSDPFAVMNLIWEYRGLRSQSSDKWCRRHGIFAPRLKRLVSTCENLKKRVAGFLGISDKVISIDAPPKFMPHAMVSVLRVVQVWVFYDTMIQFDPSKIALKGQTLKKGFAVPLKQQSDRVEEGHLSQVLHDKRHSVEVRGQTLYTQKGSVISVTGKRTRGIDAFLLSFATERDLSYARCSFLDSTYIFLRSDLQDDPEVGPLMEKFGSFLRTQEVAAETSNGPKRGRNERPCGLWSKKNPNDQAPLLDTCRSVRWLQFFVKHENLTKKECKYITAGATDEEIHRRTKAWISLVVDSYETCFLETLDVSTSFTVKSNASEVSTQDLKDLLCSPKVKSSLKKTPEKQSLFFPNGTCSDGEDLSGNGENGSSSFHRPLLRCIPEGARLVSVLASGRRREHMVRLLSKESWNDDDAGKSDGGTTEESYVDLHPDPAITRIASRWKRVDTDKVVFVEPNSVPSSAFPAYGSDMIYCCCANTLEVKGGALRAEGLTLLPPGKLYLLLCRLTFGLYNQESLDDGSLVKKCIRLVDPDCDALTRSLLEERISKAIAFHVSSLHLGEELICFPDNVKDLLSVFDKVDGYRSEVWDTLGCDPFVKENLAGHQRQFRQQHGRNRLPEESSEYAQKQYRSRKKEVAASNRIEATNSRTTKMDETDPKLNEQSNTMVEMSDFGPADMELSTKLFCPTGSPGQQVGEDDLPSSNILALIVKTVRDDGHSNHAVMSFGGPDWKIYTIEIDKEKFFHAMFTNEGLAYVKRNSKNSPAWLKRTDASKTRPNSVSAAVSCVPHTFARHLKQSRVVSKDGRDVLVFPSLELAVQMEAAFWLERQFLTGKKHWFQQHDVPNMIGKLKSECKSLRKQIAKTGTRKGKDHKR